MLTQERQVDFFLEACGLKWMPRAGWAMRGVQAPESVADHSFGVALMTITLADAMRASGDLEDIDIGRAVSIALLHDLAEVRLTDLPAAAVRLLGEEDRHQAEERALRDLLRDLAPGQCFLDLWREFEDASSPEGRLVRDADKLEMMAQCLRYEQAGCRGLGEFWLAMDQHAWHYPDCDRLYRLLRKRRSTERMGSAE